MNIKKSVLMAGMILLSSTYLSCSSVSKETSSPADLRGISGEVEDHFAHLPAGGRRSLHGMVLVGKGPYFIEHIPMLSSPHDFQIIAEVSLKDKSGKVLSQNFSNRTFTLKPLSNFSLNDFLGGRLVEFRASIHDGNFEQAGPIIKGFEDVQVNVIELLEARQLPAKSDKVTFEYTDGSNHFSSNVITEMRNRHQIINTTISSALWCVVGPEFFENCP